MAFSFLSSISSFLVWLTVKNANLKRMRAQVSSYGHNKLAILVSNLVRAEESPISDAQSASWLRRFSASLCLSSKAFSRSLSIGGMVGSRFCTLWPRRKLVAPVFAAWGIIAAERADDFSVAKETVAMSNSVLPMPTLVRILRSWNIARCERPRSRDLQ